VWTIEFFVEAEDSTSVSLMEEDFEYVPVIFGLDETIEVDKNMFITCNNPSLSNIIFKRLDK